jgi:hypothetical protein
MVDCYEYVDGQVVYCPEQANCDRGITAHEGYVHRIYRMIRDGLYLGFIMAAQLEIEGLEDFGLCRAATLAHPGFMEDAKREVAFVKEGLGNERK